MSVTAKNKPPNHAAVFPRVLRSSNLAATKPAHLRTGTHSGSDSGPHVRQKSGPKKQTFTRPSPESDVELSAPRSAPAKSYLSQDLWDMPVTPKKTPQGGPDVLTWQQEFFKQQQQPLPQPTPDRAKTKRPVSNSVKTSPPRKNKKRERPASGKPTDDSGSDSAAQIKRAEAHLQRLSIEVDDLFASSSSPATLRATITTPAASPLPKKKAKRPQSAISLLQRTPSANNVGPRAQDDLALHAGAHLSTPNHRYAGPEFHNSPSPASLPIPAFRRTVVQAAW